MENRKALFNKYRREKEAIDARITSKEFKDGLIAKIGGEKDRIIT